MSDAYQPDNGFYVLVTGANSGLGLGIGTRLIDEFLHTRPQTESLVLIITTRDQRKGDATIEVLEQHLRKVCRRAEKTLPGISQVLQRRVFLRQERLDLLSLVSVQKLSKKLRKTTPKLDVVICNAGIGGWTGINWPLAFATILRRWKTSTTWPKFKLAGVGWTTRPQLPPAEGGEEAKEPPLGEVFCANFFGHYLLGHYIAPLLAKHAEAEHTLGRLIWTSSLEAYEHSFDMQDIQCMAGDQAYESSKRMTDLMSITSIIPSTERYVNRYLEYEHPSEKTTKPRIYLSHPGITHTPIMPLVWILDYAWRLVCYISRWLGSQWHVVSVDKGATAAVWLALAEQSSLDAMEEREGVGKWGSACDVWGNERVERTEIEGWGWGGRIGEKSRKYGRSPYAKALTEEDKARFLREGEQCWEAMEQLRVDWENRLEEAGVGVSMD
ncbi:3-keto-steroid reductase [Kalmusia sp. IMI 367209]|nr:3-keto-steroid reductase [Kalmusia sp. IMI 367209]